MVMATIAQSIMQRIVNKQIMFLSDDTGGEFVLAATGRVST